MKNIITLVSTGIDYLYSKTFIDGENEASTVEEMNSDVNSAVSSAVKEK